MTTELPQFSQRRSETRNEDLRTPMLDLFNIQTLAEEIAAEPDGSQVKRHARQIVEHCEIDDVARVREAAEQIRQTSLPGKRTELANAILLEVGEMMREREAMLTDGVEAKHAKDDEAPISAAG